MNKKLILIVCFLSINCQAQNIIENSMPGLWQINLEVKEGLKTLHKTQIKKCITKSELEMDKMQQIKELIDKKKLNCQPAQISNSLNTTEFKMSCIPQDKTSIIQTLEVRATYKSETMSNNLLINYKVQEKDQSSKEISTQIMGQRLGDCKQ